MRVAPVRVKAGEQLSVSPPASSAPLRLGAQGHGMLSVGRDRADDLVPPAVRDPPAGPPEGSRAQATAPAPRSRGKQRREAAPRAPMSRCESPVGGQGGAPLRGEPHLNPPTCLQGWGGFLKLV